ncbi:Uncharacterised protein [BD1-7 clade bacterium]|nr:Uncharacterised protein [BD1-7 clade bacterium]
MKINRGVEICARDIDIRLNLTDASADGGAVWHSAPAKYEALEQHF